MVRHCTGGIKVAVLLSETVVLSPHSHIAITCLERNMAHTALAATFPLEIYSATL